LHPYFLAQPVGLCAVGNRSTVVDESLQSRLPRCLKSSPGGIFYGAIGGTCRADNDFFRYLAAGLLFHDLKSAAQMLRLPILGVTRQSRQLVVEVSSREGRRRDFLHWLISGIANAHLAVFGNPPL
jgi:hypothetical protein